MRSRLSYANVMSSIAVFLVLGGVSWAAATLPKNSVGAAQIKTGAVAASEVKDKSLTKDDFAAGVLSSGPQGVPGAKGETGTQGLTGSKGEPGAAAPCETLLCPINDLPDGGYGQLFIDGSPLAKFPAYRIDCPSATVCTLTIGGPTTANIEYDAWYELAALNPAGSKKNLSFVVYNAAGVAQRRWHITNGIPVERRHLLGRFQLKFGMDFLQRVSI